MKKIKSILSVFLILGGLGIMINDSFFGGLSILLLAIILFPIISAKLSEKIALWNKRPLRYVVYISLLLLSGGLAKKAKVKVDNNKSEASSKKNISSSSLMKDSFETCNFGGDEFYIIPDMNAADVYLNFENKGFKIDKQIGTGNTSIYCELSSPDTKFVIIITGCSPSEIIGIEATAMDYSGNNQNDVVAFLGYVATLQYKNSEPEKAREWLKENIDVDGAKTTIGGVTFTINFKTVNSKALTIEIHH
ncbi:hypothetical protein [Flavobacterium mekongense]|uniref:hypothetical protein n=1 Tax=Flavobacterium mekongense TaxID=3379707 RepID=UPI00399A39DC